MKGSGCTSILAAGLVLEAGCLGIVFLASGTGDGRALPLVCLLLLMGAVWCGAVRAVTGAGKNPPDRDLRLILGFALLFYLTLLPGPPLFDDDLHRYLWDGKVTLSGINPYRYAPDDPALSSLRDPGWHAVGYPSLPTPYPPAAQVVFAAVRLVSGGSLWAAKAFLGLFFAASVWLVLRLLAVAGRDRRLVILWAWNPLVLKEFAQSGHVDVAAVCLLLTAILLVLSPPRGTRDAQAAAVLAAAAGIKIFPLFAAPFLLFRSRRPVRFAIIFMTSLGLLALPFLGAGTRLLGSLGTYYRYWLFNHGPYGPWEALWTALVPGRGALLARGLFWGGVAVAALILGRRWRDLEPGDFAERLGMFLFAMVLLSPVVMPWYLTWGLALVVFRFRWPVHGFAVLSGLSYLYYLGHRDIPAARGVEYAALAMLLWWEWRARVKKRGRM